MKRLSLLLMGLIGVELVTLALLTAAPRMVEIPRVDLTLLGDRVAVETLASLGDELDVGSASHWKRLGEYYLTYGYYPQSQRCFQQAERLAPNDESLLLLRAISLDRMGRKDAAIPFYRQAIEQNSADAASFRIRIAHCLLAEGDEGAAEKELRTMGADPQAQLVLSRMLMRSGRTAEAQPILEELHREFPSGIEPAAMLSWVAEEAGDDQQAYRLQKRAWRTQENIGRNVLIRAEDLQRRRQHSNHVYHQLSLELEAAGRMEEARQACRAAIDAMWEEEMVRSYALLELNLGQPQKAIELLEEAIHRVGASSATLDVLGDAWNATGDAAKARAAWLGASEMQATEALHNKLGDSFASSGDQDRARWHRGLAHYQRGKQAWLENRISDAREAFEAATEQASAQASSWYYLAETQLIADEPAAAQQSLEKCLELNPNHGRARRSLQDLQQTNSATEDR